MATLGAIVHRMAEAARRADVQIVAGDTKVVERGRGDGLYINTSGVGVVPVGVPRIGPGRARPGDAVIVSGTIGDHGIAVMSVREGLEFETRIESDCAPLASLAQAIVDVAGRVHVLRDPTRGGLAATLNEIARQSKVSILVEERAVPVKPQVRAACELLGLDPGTSPTRASWSPSSPPGRRRRGGVAARPRAGTRGGDHRGGARRAAGEGGDANRHRRDAGRPAAAGGAAAAHLLRRVWYRYLLG